VVEEHMQSHSESSLYDDRGLTHRVVWTFLTNVIPQRMTMPEQDAPCIGDLCPLLDLVPEVPEVANVGEHFDPGRPSMPIVVPVHLLDEL